MKNSFLIITLFLISTCAFAKDQQGIYFTENKNQWNSDVNYKADIQGGHIYFANNYIKYVYYNVNDVNNAHEKKHDGDINAYNTPINCYAYDVQFLQANKQPTIKKGTELSFYQNYFIGNDANKWASNVKAFEAITYQNLYPNIDLVAYSQNEHFKYDFIVKKNTSADIIKLAYNGVKPSIQKNGNLLFDIGFNQFQELAPYTYQVINDKKIEIESKYTQNKDGTISFSFPKGYNKEYELVIDPTLIFATHSGSTGMTFGFSATYDALGSLYSGGECFNVGWPSTVGAFQLTFGGGVDCGINKYTPTGTGLIYSTYFGGSDSDTPNSMITNASNELIICGTTSSTNLATTAGCFDNSFNGFDDIYVVHFNGNGTALLGSTFIGGTDIDGAINHEVNIDANNNILVASNTSSSNFPTTVGAYQTALNGTGDGCFFKLNPTCTSLIFSSFIGGGSDDKCLSVKESNSGNIVICGNTQSTNFPVTPGAYHTIYQGGFEDGFVCIFNNNGSTLLNSTYIGTIGQDIAYRIQIDAANNVYVCGTHDPTNPYPVSGGVYSNPGGNIYIDKLNPTLSASLLSTRVGGITANNPSFLSPTAFLLDNCENVYVSSQSASSGNLPLSTPTFQSTVGGFWLCVLQPAFTGLTYATYLGSIGDHIDGGSSKFDPQGIVYQSICTNTSGVFQSPGCWSPTNGTGSWDVACLKFNLELSAVVSGLSINPNDTGCAPFPVTFTNNSVSANTFLWNFGDGSPTSNIASPTHTFLNPGTYTVSLIASNSSACVPSDTSTVTINVAQDIDASFVVDYNLGCDRDTVNFILNTTPPTGSSIFWDNDLFQSVTPSCIYPTQGNYIVTCYANNGFCKDTFSVPINTLHPLKSEFVYLPNDSICVGGTIILASISVPQNVPSLQHIWIWGDGTANSTGLNPTHIYTQAGNYLLSLVVKDTLGCTDTSSVTIYVENDIFTDFTINKTEICVGEPIFIKDTISSNVIGFKYNFNDGSSSSNMHNPMHTFETGNPNQTITLTADSKYCADKVVTKQVKVNDYPVINLGPDTSICPGITSSILLTNLNNPNTLGLWNTGENAASISVTSSGWYWLQQSNGTCKTVDTIFIKNDCFINIPNSFSPNGDGLNDYFLPRALLSSGLRKFSMSIYNRWGEQVFTTASINGRGWDGKFGSKDQQLGVYVYVIDVEFKNNIRKNFTGNITLMR
jgi:gliding motility-associated-like protein